MTDQQMTWLLDNWQVLFGILVVSCVVAFALLLTVIFLTIIE